MIKWLKKTWRRVVGKKKAANIDYNSPLMYSELFRQSLMDEFKSANIIHDLDYLRAEQAFDKIPANRAYLSAREAFIAGYLFAREEK